MSTIYSCFKSDGKFNHYAKKESDKSNELSGCIWKDIDESIWDTNYVTSKNIPLLNTTTQEITWVARDPRVPGPTGPSPHVARVGGIPELIIDNSSVRSLRRIKQGSAVYPSDNGMGVLSGMYSMVSSKTIQNTTTETSLFNDTDSKGSRTLPGGMVSCGDSFILYLSGTADTQGGTPLTVRLKINGTTYATSANNVLSLNPGDFWEVHIQFTCVGDGVNGSLVGNGRFLAQNGRSFEGTSMSVLPITLDSTIPLTFDVTAQWGSAHIDDNITANVATFTTAFMS